MSSDILHCLPTSGDVAVETAPQPLSTSSTGLPSSPSVSVSSNSPSQSSPSSACGSSPTDVDRTRQMENEENEHRNSDEDQHHVPEAVNGTTNTQGLLAEKPATGASVENENDFVTGGTDSCCSSSVDRAELALSTGRGGMSSLADGSSGAASDHEDSVASFSSSASPVRESCHQSSYTSGGSAGASEPVSVQTNATANGEHSTDSTGQFYPQNKNYLQQPQRLTNAARPRRLRLSRPFAHRVGGAGSVPMHHHAPSHLPGVGGDFPGLIYSPHQQMAVGLDFSPSSNSSSPLTGYGPPPLPNMCPCCVGAPMNHHVQPYQMLSGLVYQSAPVPLMGPIRSAADLEQQSPDVGSNGDVASHHSSGNDACSTNAKVASNQKKRQTGDENGPETGGSAMEGGQSAGMQPQAPHVVQVHVNPGVIFNVRVGDEVHHITGPATVPMVSPTGPPHPLPLQVPPGHVVQQVIDEHGTLRHVILSLQQPAPPHAVYGPPPTANNTNTAGSQMMEGEYMGAMTAATSSPSHGGVVNGGVASSGSGGSRTNTPPSPPTSVPHHSSHPLSATSTTFQPSPNIAPPGAFTLYHAMPPPFMSHPASMLQPHPGMSMPPGPPMPGHPYPAVSPVGLVNGPPVMTMDGGYQQQSTGVGSSNSRGYHRGVDSGFQGPRGYRANMGNNDHGRHKSNDEAAPVVHEDSSTEDSVNCQNAMYDMSQSSPVILVNGNGAPILVHDGYEISVANGQYPHLAPVGMDQYSSNIHHRKAMDRTNGSYPVNNNNNNNNGGPRRWRKQVPNNAMPVRLRPTKPDEPSGHTDNGDDSSSSGGGAVPSSPRPRGHSNSMDSSKNKSFNATSNDKDKSTDGGQPLHDGNENGENGASEGQTAPPPEISEEEKERRRIIEAIEAALSHLGPPKLINVTATSLTVEMASLPIDRVAEVPGLEPLAAASVKQNVVYDVALSVPQRDNLLENIYTGQAAEVNVVDLKPATHYSLGVAALYTGQPYASASDPIRGASLPLLNFQTQPSAPDRPDPPKLAIRNAVKSNSMNLRWAPPNCENGSPVTAYVLEWKQGPSVADPKSVGQTQFTELFRCAADVRIYRCVNLLPATLYSFRLAAMNAIGQSPFSDEVSYRTSGAPPPAPESPQLRQAGVSTLTLSWPATLGGAVSSSAMEFILQMDDLISGHGFLPVYKGADVTEYTIRNLRRNSEYRFRLSAENEDGQSKWSEPVVSYRTLPDAPLPPTRLNVKSAAPKSATSPSAHSLRLCWEAPRDDGGAPIEGYDIEAVESVNAGEQEITSPVTLSVSGTEREALIDGLHPGRAYKCRVRSRGVGGTSNWSDVIMAGTAATCPGTCALAPVMHGRAKSTSLAIKWSAPTSDGGASVTSYEVRVAKVSNSKLISPSALSAADITEWEPAYEGPELTCVVQNLAPGRQYVFQVRATNRVGPGPWNPLVPSTGPTSVPVTFLTTAAAPPDAPASPVVSPSSAHVICVTWAEPVSNGARVTEYRLESSESSFPFLLLYSGSQLSFEAKSLQPATQYSFRLQALNSAGASPYSPVVSCQTPPAPPSAPSEITVNPVSPSSVQLEWLPPADHGSPILSYTISVSPGDHIIKVPLIPTSSSPTPTANSDEELQQSAQPQSLSPTQQLVEHVVEDLLPDTVYRVRVQAINSLGAGAFSAPFKVTTPPLPPQPPELELAEATHNSLRIRWAAVPPASTVTPGTDLVEYTLFMDRPTAPLRLQPIFTGPALSFRVNRLQERTQYRFAIQAKTQSGGLGPQSATPRVFTTLPSPPPVATGLAVSLTGSSSSSSLPSQGEGDVPKHTSISVSWKPVAVNSSLPSLPIEYVLQWTTATSSSFTQLYRGPETSFTIPSNLLASGSFSLRVAAAFLLGDEFSLGQQSTATTKSGGPASLLGQFSPVVPFRVHKSSNESLQLLPAGTDVPQRSAPSQPSAQGGAATAVKTAASSGAPDATVSVMTRLLEVFHLRRRVDADNEAWTDTQLAAGFVFAFAVLAVVLSYVAHAFLSSAAS